MAEMKWSPEDWARLGVAIRKSREGLGLSRKKLSEWSGISEKSIQLTEEGRVPTRWPKSLQALEDALGWTPRSVANVLDGGEPTQRQRDFLAPFPSVSPAPDSASFHLARGGQPATEREDDRPHEVGPEVEHPERTGSSNTEEGATSAWFAPTPAPQKSSRSGFRPSQVGLHYAELAQSGVLAQDTFVRQMKRYRALKNVSIEQLAQAIAELQGFAPPGGGLGVAELKHLEEGTRPLKGAEAELIAAALDTTVGWLLGSGFSSDAPDSLKKPPTYEELQAEAKAVERRIGEVGRHLQMVRAQYEQAKEHEVAARQQVHLTEAMLAQVTSEQQYAESQYQYLLGRIDSLRAAKGEELIVQVHPAHEDNDPRFHENTTAS